MSQHTQEPWKANGEVIEASSTIVGSMLPINPNRAHDTIRIVACVNACTGIPTDVLERIAKAHTQEG